VLIFLSTDFLVDKYLMKKYAGTKNK